MRLVVIISYFISTIVVAAEFDAQVDWAKRVDLGLLVSGTVEMVNAQVGQKLSKDDLLLSLESAPFKTAQHRARVAYAASAALLEDAKNNLTQVTQLYERTVSSEAELKQATLQHLGAQSAYQDASTEIAKANYNLAKSRIKMPFNGWLLVRDVEIGESVVSRQTSKTLLTVAQADHYVARVFLPLHKIKNVSLGDAVQVNFAANQYEGFVRSMGLEPAVSEANASPTSEPKYALEVTFQAQDPLLRAGSRVKLVTDWSD